jgi:processive 1,2-diacylglycerol beta-glucosyltransferase
MGDDLVLILTASAGAGHLVAARGLEQAFRARAPHLNVEVLDILSISNMYFRRLYADGYLGMVRHAPAFMGWLYDAMDRPGGRVWNAIRIYIQNANRLPTYRYLLRRKPRLVVNTHYLSAEFVAQMRRDGRLRCPQVTVTTDFETHRIWVQEPTERYYTATCDGKTYLQTWGAALEKIRVTGIPVRAGFGLDLPREEARRRVGLHPTRPAVLLLCGGFGVGPTGELLSELLRMPVDAHIIAITGRNEKLRMNLERQAAGSARPVSIVGYADNVQEWMRAVDLVVTKPGGLTVAESLACGLPLVIVNPIPGQETRNSDYLLENGAGMKVNSTRLVGHRVSTLFGDPARLAALRAAAQRLARPNAARDIVEDALTLI